MAAESAAARLRAGEVQLFARSGAEWLPDADKALADLLDAIREAYARWPASWSTPDIVAARDVLEAAILRSTDG